MSEQARLPPGLAQLGSRALFQTLENLQVVSSAGTGAILYDAKYDADGSLSDDLAALAISRTLGISDRAARRYADGPSRRPAQDRARSTYVSAYRQCDQYLGQSLDALRTNPDAPMTLGIYAASIALHRLRFSFFAAHLLYQLRLRLEADSVARHILEQIAWAVVVADVSDHSAIDRVEPQSCIGTLKKLVPEAGPLYGLLSKSAHAGVNYHRAQFDTDADDRGFIEHGVTDWAGSATIMLTLALVGCRP